MGRNRANQAPQTKTEIHHSTRQLLSLGEPQFSISPSSLGGSFSISQYSKNSLGVMSLSTTPTLCKSQGNDSREAADGPSLKALWKSSPLLPNAKPTALQTQKHLGQILFNLLMGSGRGVYMPFGSRSRDLK